MAISAHHFNNSACHQWRILICRSARRREQFVALHDSARSASGSRL